MAINSVSSTTENLIKEHDAVVRYISEKNKNRYKVLSNLDGEKVYVGGLFPDILFQDTAGNLLFIVEVKNNGYIAQCIQQWKNATTIPAVLYIIVPENELANAKSIAQVVGLQVRFGSYTLDTQTNEVTVKYE